MNQRNYLTSMPRSIGMANNLLLKTYRQMRKIEPGTQPVVWMDINFPAFIIWAMDIFPIFPQIHASFQAQRRKGKKMLADLETKYEIPHSICSEVKGLIGTAIYGSEVDFELPEPDFLVTANTSCNIVSKGLRYLSSYTKKDLLFADVPYVYKEITDEMTAYVSTQIYNVIQEVERRTGKPFVLEKARQAAGDSMLAYKLLDSVIALNQAQPAPADALDLFLFSSLLATVEHNDDFFNVFITLYNEIAGQINRNKNLEANEKYRILWHYLPVSTEKKFFQNLFNEYKISAAAASYFPAPDEWYEHWDFQFTYPLTRQQIEEARQSIINSGIIKEDLNRFIADLALGCLQMDVNSSIAKRESLIVDLIKRYTIDGVIIHCDRSCRTQSLPQLEIKRFLSDELSMPVLLFDADSMDERFFSSGQILTRFEAFIEMLEKNNTKIKI